MSNKTDLEQLTQEERAAVEARREYQRKWRSEHKDNVREHNKRYWLKKARQAASEQFDTNRKENDNDRQTDTTDENH